ncbi:MAG: SAM-dependent methyltransferase [Bacteroidota bacterium]
MAKLYLLPNLLSESPWQNVLPSYNAEVINQIRHFIVEDIRNARRFLKKVNRETDIDSLTFMELNKHTPEMQKNGYLDYIQQGFDVGIISEAGCPGVADPGAEMVKIAYRRGMTVVPLVGPSSILLALMASGMNGQSFAFTGYLPVKKPDRLKRIQQLERQAVQQKQSQIFMETPYRNNHLLNDLLATCQPGTSLCIAADITSENQMIRTRTIADWKKQKPDLEKKPVIFILGS